MQANTETTTTSQSELTTLQKHLLNDFQHNFPLTSRPYKQIAEMFGVRESDIINNLNILKEQGFISRVGAVFRANSIGASTLAAMTIPEAEIDSVAEIINSYDEVNHNYLREHKYNMWFVVTASDDATLNNVLDDIEHRSGYGVMYLPMLQDFHIDLGFDLGFDTELVSEQKAD